jgi:hypothetical protein
MPKQNQSAIFKVIHHREFFVAMVTSRSPQSSCWLGDGRQLVHFAISSYLISRKCKIFRRLSLRRVFARV